MTQRPTHETVAGTRYLALRRMARGLGRPTAELLQIHMLEGFLARLARSPHRDRLVLKGGMLLAAFELRRPTRDVDLLALRTDNDQEAIREIIRDITAADLGDGLVFHLDTISSTLIRDEDSYPGIRVRVGATLSTAKLVFQADVNVGDPVVPSPVRTALPTLLGDQKLELLAYPEEMVVAEKLVTALQRGRANTRWRDFADLVLLLGSTDIAPSSLAAAVREVARHRRTPVRTLADALEGMAEEAQPRWTAWWSRQGLEGRVPAEFAEVLSILDAATREVLDSLAREDGAGPGITAP